MTYPRSLLVNPSEPDQSKSWSDEEVQLRWARVMRQREGDMPAPARVSDDRIARLRGRLSDSGWFMCCLNETIARRANAQDKVTRRFWQGRFRCQLLLPYLAWISFAAVLNDTLWRLNPGV